MGLRLPRPLKALRSLILAAQGDWFELYRIPYKIEETGAVGAIVWMKGPDMEPTLIANSEAFYLDPGRTYIVNEAYKTTVRGEELPVYDLVAVEDVTDDDEVVSIPEKFLDRQIPPIDRKDEFLK